MYKSFKATIYPNETPVIIEVTIDIKSNDPDDPGEFTVDSIVGETKEFVFEELTPGDQVEIEQRAWKYTDELAYEAYLEKNEGRESAAYDKWVDDQAEKLA